MQRAMGISVHTGWGACVVVSGSPANPEILANEVIAILGDSERFCFHMAAEMEPDAAKKWLAGLRTKALGNARRALGPHLARVNVCAIVARTGDAGELCDVLVSHPRIHTAEGCFYRDVLCAAAGDIPTKIVPPASLDISGIGRLAPPPWGRDQKLAALAGWTVIPPAC